MLRIIKYQKGVSLKEISPDFRACENDVDSILTQEGWKIPEEGDYIKEVTPKCWNIIGKSEIRRLAYNINGLLSTGSGVDAINNYYIDALGLPAVELAVSQILDNLTDEDYNNKDKMKNLHKLTSWLFRKVAGEK